MPKKPKPPDPDRLVREQPGVYRSEDGRFTVRSDAAGAWYVGDGERTNELGLDLVFGPLATLAEAKNAVRRQREEPTGQTADEAAALAATALTLPARTRPKRPKRPSVAEAEAEPEPPAKPEPAAKRQPPAEPEPAAEPVRSAEREPPTPAVHRARRRRTNDARDDVAAAIRRINDAWLEGRVDDVAQDLDEQVVFVQPGFDGRLEGRKRAIQSYSDFVASATVRQFTESDLSVDLWGDTAVATYRFEIEWEAEGEQHRDRGHDLFVFRLAPGSWRAVLRLRTEEAPGSPY
jgi:ketosteroid isomerase-like protein